MERLGKEGDAKRGSRVGPGPLRSTYPTDAWEPHGAGPVCTFRLSAYPTGAFDAPSQYRPELAGVRTGPCLEAKVRVPPKWSRRRTIACYRIARKCRQGSATPSLRFADRRPRLVCSHLLWGRKVLRRSPLPKKRVTVEKSGEQKCSGFGLP